MPQRVPGLSSVSDVAVASSVSCAIGDDGTGANQLFCWSTNAMLTALGITAGATPRAAVLSGEERRIVVGPVHGCVIRDSGAVACFGTNSSGQLGRGSTVVEPGVVDVPGLTDVVDVAVGSTFSCAAEADGEVWCWGANDLGQLGDGTNTQRSSPVRVSGLSATEIEAGHQHACAIDAAGFVHCWGANDVGQLGDGSYVARNLPVRVTALPVATAIGLGFSHGCALVSGGVTHCWGAGFQHQLGVDPPLTSRPTSAPVAGAPAGTVLSTGPTGLASCVADTGSDASACWGSGPWGSLGGGETIYFPLTDVVLP
jgi:hypothetical protein